MVSTDFVKNIKEVNYKLAEEMSKCLLSDWATEVRSRLKSLNEQFEKPSKIGEGMSSFNVHIIVINMIWKCHTRVVY